MSEALARAGAFVRGLSGWRRLVFAWVCGLLSALAFAPFNFFPALLLGYAALVLLLDARGARPVRAAALCGWAFGFGQFLLGLHWIGYAFLVDRAAHEWQIPFVAVLFPGGLALFTAAAAALAARLWRQGPARLLVFTVCLALAEWLRGHILTGFPWNIAAYGWGASLAILQSAALFGAYGLSVLTILFAASLAGLFEPRPAWRWAAAMTGLFALLWVGGALRLAAWPGADVPGVRLRLVQPNIPQADKYKLSEYEGHWRRLLALSSRPGSPTVIVWPEAAASPYLNRRGAEAFDDIAALTARGRILMTGAVRPSRGPDGEPVFYNSLLVFGGGRLTGIYDKFHLVPFGEFLPFEETLGALGLTKLTGIDGGFASGDGPHTYDVPGAPPAGPLICYEILFPGEVVGTARPGWFVNVTDDSWFGPWAGPLQHLLVARVRAIEEGIPVVRAANTGISAVIDPLGRITSELGLGLSGSIDAALPAAIEHTAYSRLHEVCFWLLVGTISALSLIFPKEFDAALTLDRF